MLLGPLFTQQGNDLPGQTPTPTPVVQRIKFKAESVDANIERTLRIVRVRGFTDETNMDTIVFALMKADGIESLQANPFFGQPERDREKFLPVVAEVLVKEETDFTELKQEIEKEGVLSDVFFSVHALLKIPQEITIESINAELGLEREYLFSQPFAEALVNIDALPGDKMKIFIEMELAGDQLVSLTAYEEENLSSKPVPRSAEATAVISSLESETGFTGTIRFGGLNVLEIERELEEIEDVNKVSISLSIEINSFFIHFNAEGLSQEEITVVEKDIDSAIKDTNGIYSVSFDSNEETIVAEIAFERPETLAAVRADALASLSQAGLGERIVLIENPLASISGKIIFLKESLSGTIDEVRAVLLAKGMPLTLFQPATVSVQELTDLDTGEEFPYSEPISARLFPGYSEGGEVEVDVAFYTQRGIVMLAQASEREV